MINISICRESGKLHYTHPEALAAEFTLPAKPTPQSPISAGQKACPPGLCHLTLKHSRPRVGLPRDAKLLHRSREQRTNRDGKATWSNFNMDQNSSALLKATGKSEYNYPLAITFI